jgi:hypothetical protein
VSAPLPFWREVSRDGRFAVIEVDQTDFTKIQVTVPVTVLDSGDPSDAIRLIVQNRQSTRDDLRATT